MLIATVNIDWSEFNPSPFSTHYFSVPRLGNLLQSNGFKAKFYGAFSTIPKTVKESIEGATKLRYIDQWARNRENLGRKARSARSIAHRSVDYRPTISRIKRLIGFLEDMAYMKYVGRLQETCFPCQAIIEYIIKKKGG